MFESIMWFAIGFGLTYGAMELAWRIAKRRIRTAAAPEITVTTRTTTVPTSQ